MKGHCRAGGAPQMKGHAGQVGRAVQGRWGATDEGPCQDRWGDVDEGYRCIVSSEHKSLFCTTRYTAR